MSDTPRDPPYRLRERAQTILTQIYGDYPVDWLDRVVSLVSQSPLKSLDGRINLAALVVLSQESIRELRESGAPARKLRQHQWQMSTDLQALGLTRELEQPGLDPL